MPDEDCDCLECLDYSYDYDYDEEENEGMIGHDEMVLRYHAGHCCGVKTIEGFWRNPADNVRALFKYTPSKTVPGSTCVRYQDDWVEELRHNHDKRGNPITSTDRFYYEERPREPAIERLKVYLDYLAKVRPSGMVDCYLVDSQVRLWDKTLKDLGFTVVNRWKNSNSGGYISCYQLCYGQPAEKSAKKVVPSFAST